MRTIAVIIATAAALAIAPAADAKPHKRDRVIVTCPRQPVTADLVCFRR